jgi:hypothetical protein
VKPARAAAWTVGILLTLGAALGVAWQLIRQHAIVAAEQEHAFHAAMSRPKTAAPRRDAIADDAAGSADAWQARAEHVVQAKNARLFNADVARLLALPPDEAWPLLADRAIAGDIAAGAAAIQLSIFCSTLSPDDGYVNGTRPNIASGSHPALPESWKHFLDVIETHERERTRMRVAHCAGVGDGIDLALILLGRFLEPTDPDVQLVIAKNESRDAQAIADLREIAAKHPAANAEGALGERLLDAGDAADQSEGRAMLERLAAENDDAAIALARCAADAASIAGKSASLHHPCHAFDADPDTALQWLERAAGLGDANALDREIAKLAAEDRRADAWAWSLYRLDLALRGCFELSAPSFVHVGVAADGEESLRRTLDAKQENAGRASANEIIGRWEAEATARLDCGD